MKVSLFAFLFLFLGIFNVSKAQNLPDVPLEYVSVVDDTTVFLKWTAQSDPRIDGYRIYLLYPNNLGTMQYADPFDVPGSAATDSWNYIIPASVDPSIRPGKKVMRFFITAFDKDVNPPEQSNLDTLVNIPHQTIYVGHELDTCNASVVLKWNEYSNARNGWQNTTTSYELWESQNGGVHTRIYSGSALTYTRDQLLSGINYQYYVRAVASTGASRISTSNIKNVNGTFAKAPAFTYLSNATVLSDNRTVVLTWLTDSANVPLTYKIMMSEDSVNFRLVRQIDTVPYQRIREVSIGGLVCSRVNYWFRIITECSCPNTLDTSNIAKPILLKATYMSNGQNLLQWNDYLEWAVGTGYYELYRVYQGEQDTMYTLPAGTNQFLDVDPLLTSYESTVYYFIRAYEDVNDPFNVQSKTQSNIAYIYKELKIVVPEAFTPNGLVPVFLPRVLSANPNKFNMQIYNRWGKLVFETDDEFLGWDGKDQDSHRVVPVGSYVYLIEIKDSTGAVTKKKGTISVID
jgi:gliding motility-associated-like protein